MKNINIAILGTIGVGKTTLLQHLRDSLLKLTDSVVVKAEPSVSIPFINNVLQKFYSDNVSWCIPLQLSISAAQEGFFQELRETEYDYSIFDMPYSSDIYSYSYMKHGKMSDEMHHNLEGISSHFPFDYVIVLQQDKETTIERVKKRNAAVIAEESKDPSKQDVVIEDFSYLDDHIEDFGEYFPVWLARFKNDNPNVEFIKVNNIPELGTKEYTDLINNIVKTVTK